MTSGGTETFTTRYWGLEEWPDADILAAMLDDQLAALAALRACLPAMARACAAAGERLAGKTGRLVYAGAGTSARLAVQDGVELVPTYGWPEARLAYLIAGGPDALTRSIEGAEDDVDAARRDVAALRLDRHDVVIAVSASGRTPYTVAAAAAAHDAGALTIGIANNDDDGSGLLGVCGHPILAATGPEPVAGSTRMTAGTAQKIILNLISTLLMIRAGRVYGGLMVDMQASNDKLRARALRMVMHLTGADESDAQAALDAAGGHVKLAVLIHHGKDAASARALLERHDGDLRRALAAVTAARAS